MGVSFTTGDQNYYTYFRKQVQAETGLDIGLDLALENPHARPDMVAYMTEGQTIEGQWIGRLAAATGLDDTPSLRQMADLYERAVHPLTGQQLGKNLAVHKTLDELVAAEMIDAAKAGLDITHPQVANAVRHNLRAIKLRELKDILPVGAELEAAAQEAAETHMQALENAGADLSYDEVADAVRTTIRRRLQHEMRDRHSVVSIDFTASATKSVSALWGMYKVAGDTEKAQALEDAVQRAAARTIQRFENEYLKTRLGLPGTDQVAQVDVSGGMIGTRFFHTTARPAQGYTGMPHLHVHHLISTRVRAYDPKTGELKFLQMDTATARDARQILSAYMDLAVEQEVTAALGVEFVTPEHQLSKRIGEQNREIKGLHHEAFLDGWSMRSEVIRAEAAQLIERFVADKGRQPTKAEERRMFQQANLDTREAKQDLSEEETLAQWAQVATDTLGADWLEKVHTLPTQQAVATLAADDVSYDARMKLAAQAVAEIEASGATCWTRNKLEASVVKVLKGHHGATIAPDALDELITSITRMAANEQSVPCNAAMAVDASVDASLARRADGTSVFVRHGEQLFTSASILKKEADMLAWAQEERPGHRISLPRVEQAVWQVTRESGFGPADDQRAAVDQLAQSACTVIAMNGAAGTGKTTTMRTFAKAAQLSGRKVIGIGMAEIATSNLKREADLDEAYNMSQLRERVNKGIVQFEWGGIYIVDEASTLGLHDLHWLTENARRRGGQVILTGDWRQQNTVMQAGGTHRLIHENVGGAELTSVWRFQKVDENGHKVRDEEYADLSLRLRTGDVTVADQMIERGMVQAGTAEQMREAAIANWKADLLAGKYSLITTRSNAERAELAKLGIEAMREAGRLTSNTGELLRDGTELWVGGYVVARKNNGEIRFAPDEKNPKGDRIANRHTFTVQHMNPVTGTVRCKSTLNGKTIDVPLAYVREHMESAIATTGMGSQGLTTDTSHTLLDQSADRATTYVGVTRGREGNTLYLTTDNVSPDSVEHHFANPKAMLANIIRRDSAEKAATQRIDDDWHLANDVRTLSARHDYFVDLARVSARKEAEQALRNAVDAEVAEQVLTSAAWPTLARKMSALHVNGVDVAQAVRDSVAVSDLADAHDAAAVLTARLERSHPGPGTAAAATDTASVIAPWLRTGELAGANASEVEAVEAFRQATLARSVYLADQALRDQHAWVAALGDEPAEEELRTQYRATLTAVAAYRERFAVTVDDPTLLGATEAREDMDKVQARSLSSVEALIERYRTAQVAVPEHDLVHAGVAERVLVHGANAFTPATGAPVVPAVVPVQEPRAPWYQRTWGSVDDDALVAKVAELDRTLPAIERNLTRLEVEMDTAADQRDMLRADAKAGRGQAASALTARRDQLAAQVRAQAEVLAAREERADARATADRLQAADPATRAQAIAAVNVAEEHVRALEEVAGPDVLWGRVRADLDSLQARWDHQWSTAISSDMLLSQNAKAAHARAKAELADATKRLNEQRSARAQVIDELALRAEDKDLASHEQGERDEKARRTAAIEQARAGLPSAQPTRDLQAEREARARTQAQRAVDGPGRQLSS